MKSHEEHAIEKLAQSILVLAHEIRGLGHHNNNAILCRMEEMENRIMASQTQLAADLQAVLAQQKKTSAEIASVQAATDALNARIVELEAVIANGGEASQELTDAVAAVKAQAQALDDQIPDLPVPTP